MQLLSLHPTLKINKSKTKPGLAQQLPAAVLPSPTGSPLQHTCSLSALAEQSTTQMTMACVYTSGGAPTCLLCAAEF